MSEPLDSAALARDLADCLVRVGRDRDRTAFARLFAHFAPRVKAYLHRLGSDAGTAEELMQEVMVTVWRRAETYDPNQATAATWLFTVARNKRIDAIRRERRPEIDLNDPALVPEAPAPADDMVTARQQAVRVRLALDRLPAEQRELVVMSFFEERPHSAIAETTGLPLGTVKSRLRLALGRLRNVLREVG